MGRQKIILASIAGVLFLFVIGLGIYILTNEKGKEKQHIALAKEKSQMETELNELMTRYDETVSENESYKRELTYLKNKVQDLLDSLAFNEPDQGALERYKKEIEKYKSEREQLVKLAEQLKKKNISLKSQVNKSNKKLNETTEKLNQTTENLQKTVASLQETSTALMSNMQYSDSLDLQTESLRNIIKENSVLTLSNLVVDAVKEKSNGRLVPTIKAWKTDKVRTCFTLSPNRLAKIGERNVYVQVINPSDKLIGERQKVVFDDLDLYYSGKNTVFYEKKPLNVCVLAPRREVLVKGSYYINVFVEDQLIGSSTINLR